MAVSKLLKPFVAREIKAREDRVGRVMSAQTVRNYNDGIGATWVCDVDIGGNRLLRDVPIKANSGNRFYAQRGQSVFLRRNTQGRYDIVGPADRNTQLGNISTYTLGSATPVSTQQTGFNIVPEPFEFYKGPTPGTPGTSLWNDGATPFPLVRITDAQGNDV